MTAIRDKTDLLHYLKDSIQGLVTFFDGIAPAQFFARAGESWSAGDNLDHLCKGQQSFNVALKLPRWLLRILFGVTKQPSLSYEAVCQLYDDLLAQGASVYPPDKYHPTDPEAAKAKMLRRFKRLSRDLVESVATWDDPDLDRYLLPHPLLGRMTVRENLYFTIYHNVRHASPEED